MLNRLQILLKLRLQITVLTRPILGQLLMSFVALYFLKYVLETKNLMASLPKSFILSGGLSYALFLVGLSTALTVIEDKKRDNISRLVMSGVKGYDYIVSALIIPSLFMTLILIATPFILDIKVNNHFNYSIVILITSITINLIYLLLGLLAKNVIKANIVNLFLALFIVLVPMLPYFNSKIWVLVSFSFMGLFTDYLTHWETFTWSSSVISILSLFIWIISLVEVNLWVINKKSSLVNNLKR